MMTTTLSAELKSYTQAAHLQLEDAVIPYIRNIKSNGDYVRLLTIFYGFFAPVEVRLEKSSLPELIIDLSQRRKSSSILEDIQEAGYATENLLLCSALPDVTTLSKAVGAAYVLEGSTLGGRGIAGMIGKILPDVSFRFFLHYGDETRRMWELFKNRMDDHASLEREALLKAADETFVLFKKWIDEYPQQ